MNYEIYSAIAQSENKNTEDTIHILAKVDNFDLYKTLPDVRKYLLEKYGIKGNVSKFTLWRNCFLSVTEFEKFLQIKLECNNEVKLYYYNK